MPRLSRCEPSQSSCYDIRPVALCVLIRLLNFFFSFHVLSINSEVSAHRVFWVARIWSKSVVSRTGTSTSVGSAFHVLTPCLISLEIEPDATHPPHCRGNKQAQIRLRSQSTKRTRFRRKPGTKKRSLPMGGNLQTRSGAGSILRYPWFKKERNETKVVMKAFLDEIWFIRHPQGRECIWNAKIFTRHPSVLFFSTPPLAKLYVAYPNRKHLDWWMVWTHFPCLFQSKVIVPQVGAVHLD